MKKIIIIAFAILTTGLVSSCTKESVKPAVVKAQKTTVADKSDMGSGDFTGGAEGTVGSADGTSSGN